MTEKFYLYEINDDVKNFLENLKTKSPGVLQYVNILEMLGKARINNKEYYIYPASSNIAKTLFILIEGLIKEKINIEDLFVRKIEIKELDVYDIIKDYKGPDSADLKILNLISHVLNSSKFGDEFTIYLLLYSVTNLLQTEQDKKDYKKFLSKLKLNDKLSQFIDDLIKLINKEIEEPDFFIKYRDELTYLGMIEEKILPLIKENLKVRVYRGPYIFVEIGKFSATYKRSDLFKLDRKGNIKHFLSHYDVIQILADFIPQDLYNKILEDETWRKQFIEAYLDKLENIIRDKYVEIVRGNAVVFNNPGEEASFYSFVSYLGSYIEYFDTTRIIKIRIEKDISEYIEKAKIYEQSQGKDVIFYKETPEGEKYLFIPASIFQFVKSYKDFIKFLYDSALVSRYIVKYGEKGNKKRTYYVINITQLVKLNKKLESILETAKDMNEILEELNNLTEVSEGNKENENVNIEYGDELNSNEMKEFIPGENDNNDDNNIE